MSLPIYLAEACRLFIFIVLCLAAISKSFTFSQFKQNLIDSFNVKSQFSTTAALLVILAEGGLALMILSNGPLAYISMLGALILFVVFAGVIVVSLIQNKRISCNCFGQSNDTISYFDVSRNLIFIIACGFYLLYPNTHSITLSIQLLLGTMAVSCFIVATHLNDIAMVNANPKAN
jgi:hypothetical protein